MLFRATSTPASAPARDSQIESQSLWSRLIGGVLPPQKRSAQRRAYNSLAFQSLEQRLVMHASLGDLELHDLAAVENGAEVQEEPVAGEVLPLASIPLLSSNPNASVKLYLDFDGHFESTWGAYSNIDTPAYSLDSDYSSFSTSEINAITEIWQRVSEDFAPFNIDVTTVEPDSFANGEALRVVIGGNSSWFGSSVGGLGYVNTFTNYVVNTVYVFPNNLAKNTKYIAEASSHEAGHGFGLDHQSRYVDGVKTDEYNPGSGDWAPIMGVSYYKARTTWHDGTTTSANTYQDDMSVIARSANGFGYRTDDHGGFSSATSLNFAGNHATASGIVERMTDSDAFGFSTAGGQIDLSVNVAEVGANLDAVLELWSASGQLIATADPSGSYGASITTSVAAGDYVLIVRSTGEYGSVGQYTVSATLPTSTSTEVAISGDATVAEDAVYTLNLIEVNAGSSPITGWTINWGDGNIETITGNPGTIAHVYADGPAVYTISATATDGVGTFAANSQQVSVYDPVPVLSISGANNTTEGSTYVLSLSASDTGPAVITHWTINWGDGTIETITGNPNSASHVYADGTNNYTISATATNSAGTHAANNRSVTVNNVDAQLSISGSDSVGEGETYTLNLASTDPGQDTITSWTINWGDGVIETISGDPGSVTHVYAGGGQYTITATATDEDGSYSANAWGVNVIAEAGLAAPTNLTANANGSIISLQWQDNSTGETEYIVERARNRNNLRWKTVATLDADATSYAESIRRDVSWVYRVRAVVDVNGDGIYEDASPFSNEVVVYDADSGNDGGGGGGTTPTPQLDIAGSSSTGEGSTYVLSLTANGEGAATITHWTINWGDGTIETIDGNPDAVSHVYADGTANFTIQATATNADGTYAANSVGVTVNNVAAVLNIAGNGTVGSGESYTLNLSSSDPGQDTISSWTINWGDGTIETINGDPNSVSHTYVGGGQYTISATATDEDGSYSSNSIAVSVTSSDADLATPTNLTGQVNGNDVTLQWQDNATGETAYLVERSRQRSSLRWYTQATLDADSTSFSQWIRRDVGWVYRVRAAQDLDGDGVFDVFSDYSNEFRVPDGDAAPGVNGRGARAGGGLAGTSAWEQWAADFEAGQAAPFATLGGGANGASGDARELFFAMYADLTD